MEAWRMAEERPLREWPLEQLAEHAAMHAADSAVLMAILAELDHRPGQAAKVLARRLRKRFEDSALGESESADAEELRRCLAEAVAEIKRLRQRLEAAEAALRTIDSGVVPTTAHARVHLTPDAPLWLVAEVQRAFRRRFHPDRHSDPEARRQAELVFKEAESAFAQIFLGRNDVQ